MWQQSTGTLEQAKSLLGPKNLVKFLHSSYLQFVKHFCDLCKGHYIMAFVVIIKEMLYLSQREVHLGRNGHWWMEASKLLAKCSKYECLFLHEGEWLASVPSRKYFQTQLVSNPPSCKIRVCCALKGFHGVPTHSGLPGWDYPSFSTKKKTPPRGKPRVLDTLAVHMAQLHLLLCHFVEMVIKIVTHFNIYI